VIASRVFSGADRQEGSACERRYQRARVSGMTGTAKVPDRSLSRWRIHMLRSHLRRAAAAAAFVISATPVALAQAGGDVKAYPARVELHAVNSMTLPDTAFLKGDAAAGKPAPLAASLRVAQGPGKKPAVVLMHGSSGIGANIEYWERHFNAMGITTLAIDSMTGRGLKSVSAKQGTLGRLNFILDIYRALDVLAKRDDIDTSRIALMGFSRGGQAALYASLERFHKLWNTSGVKFAGYLAFYPACVTRYQAETDVAPVPIGIFHGAKDDYNELGPCKAYAERVKAAGKDITVHVYPDGEHGFDVPTIAGKSIHAKTSQTARRCQVSETEPGVLTNAETKAPFSYADACVQLGPHVGGDAASAQAATKDVDAMIKKVLKIEG
jgi:dienelactone hydrolase